MKPSALGVVITNSCEAARRTGCRTGSGTVPLRGEFVGNVKEIDKCSTS